MDVAATSLALEQFAQNSRLLALLDAPGRERLALHGRVQDVAAGTCIVRQGEAGDTFYLIATGEVRVRTAEAEEREVARLGAGMFFGEMAVIAGQPRSATVEAVGASRLIAFRRGPVLRILRDYPRLHAILGNTGLVRTEANLQQQLSDDDASLADGFDPASDPHGRR